MVDIKKDLVFTELNWPLILITLVLILVASSLGLIDAVVELVKVLLLIAGWIGAALLLILTVTWLIKNWAFANTVQKFLLIVLVVLLLVYLVGIPVIKFKK